MHIINGRKNGDLWRNKMVTIERNKDISSLAEVFKIKIDEEELMSLPKWIFQKRTDMKQTVEYSEEFMIYTTLMDILAVLKKEAYERWKEGKVEEQKDLGTGLF